VDSKDIQIINLLQKNARMPISELAQQVSLSDTPCLRRIKKLEQEGVIQGYHAAINRQKVGLSILVYAFVRLAVNSQKHGDSFEQAVATLDNVLECSVISGSYDYLLKIAAKDLESYERFAKQSLGNIAAIAAIDSTVVLKQTFSRAFHPI
jgi:DNA-binding Lrp family transcriptional regulator